MKCYVQTKVCERDKQCKTDKNEQISEHTETDEDDDSVHETDADGKFGFTRIVPDEVHVRKINVPEHKKKNSDDVAADKECERAIANWIEYKVKWRKSCTKKELNWDINDKIAVCKNLWGTTMHVLLDHFIQESREERMNDKCS